ncbi:MAG: hypothetical protein KGY51_11995 [Psychroflexus sp.]|nr:hypothetical protein [Psychroflexus sp.]
MKNLIDFYLSFVNDFLTVERFAEVHDLEVEDAETLIKLGKKYHEINVELYKQNKIKNLKP